MTIHFTSKNIEFKKKNKHISHILPLIYSTICHKKTFSKCKVATTLGKDERLYVFELSNCIKTYIAT